MEATDLKQRNRRRKRAKRMQQQAAQRQLGDGDSAEEDVRRDAKSLRPPLRRKKVKEALVEEDIVDGFSLLGFRTYEDLEASDNPALR